MKTLNGENWIPVCLPKLDNTGFVHCHISKIDQEMFLVLISTIKESFYELSEYRAAILENFMDFTPSRLSVVQVGLVGLRHFIAKSLIYHQFIEAEPLPPYTQLIHRERLLRSYRQMSKNEMEYIVTKNESLLFIKREEMEIWAAFHPFIQKDVIQDLAVNLVRWIKQNQDTFFYTYQI
jgi:hypothetical protein